MSWDVCIFNLKKKVSSVEEINEDILIPIATNKEFRSLLTETFPDIKWDSNCGIIERENIYIETYLGEDDNESFSNTMFFLRKSETSLFPLIDLCKKYGWQLFDTGLDQMIDLDNPGNNGYDNYKKYLDHIMKR
jgi:hypothetical protein